MSASAYCERSSGRRSERSLKDEQLLGRIKEIHATNYYAYGYRGNTIVGRWEKAEDGKNYVTDFDLIYRRVE